MNVCHSIAHGLLFFGAATLAVTAVADHGPDAGEGKPANRQISQQDGQTSRQDAQASQHEAQASRQDAQASGKAGSSDHKASGDSGRDSGKHDSSGKVGGQHGGKASNSGGKTQARAAMVSQQEADSDQDDGWNSVMSVFSFFSDPVTETAVVPSQSGNVAEPKQPLPARPPADNTPTTLPQAYGSLAERSAKAADGTLTETTPWGPFYWTLSAQDNALGMEREFAAGPFWEQRISSTRHDTFLRPLWTQYDHFAEGRHDLHILTPGFTRRMTPLSYEWNVFLFINYTRLGQLEDKPVQTFMVFPFFFWHNNAYAPEKSFWGLFPIYGEINHFFSFQRWEWVLFPIYTRINSWYNVTRTGVPYPFIQIFSNEADTARGLYLWPLYGHSELDGVYERMFWMWPLVYREIDQLHRPVPRVRQGFLPFYAFEYSEHVDDVSILMFWGWRNDTLKEYRETRYLWPLWIQGRSPERYVNRWAPFYTHSKTRHIEKWWYLWPLVQHRKVPERGVLMERSQFFYFLYWHETQTSIDNPELPKAEMRFVWPFYASYDNGAGITQMQVLSIFEVFFPHNRAMRDTYSPIFALFRQEADANTGLKRWSLLWNLVGSLETDRDGETADAFHIWPLYESASTKTPQTESDGWSILFGLLGWNSTTETAAEGAGADNAAAPAQADDTAVAIAPAASAIPPSAATETPAEATAPPPAETKNTLTLFWFDIDL